MILYPGKNIKGYTIGGKAKGLLRLRDEGVNVPDFLILPAENFDPILQQEADAASTVYERLLQFQLTDTDQELLRQTLEKWKLQQPSFIVRSSVADEDGDKDAFAGIMDSFSHLQKYEDVLEAIAKCAASAYSARAIAYRKQKGLSLQARAGIIVQQQINANISGVIFSTYPLYPQEMSIHAVWGLGEGLVGGELDADEFYLLKNGGTINRQKIALKQKQVAFDDEKGTRLAEVEIPYQQSPCLTNYALQQLFNTASLLEKKLGHPQDIEFVISSDEGFIFFVQSRPITQAIPEIVVYDNSNIQESYCGVTTPLTFSFAQRAYATVYQQTMMILSLPQKTIDAYEPVVNNLLGLVKGRIYYNINNWYKGLQLLPSFKQQKEDMERMMGVEEPVDFVTNTEKSFTKKLTLLPSLIGNLIRLLLAFSRLPKSVAFFHDHFHKQYEFFYSSLPALANAKGILEQKKLLDGTLLQNWTTPIINDFYVMMMNGRVRRKLKRLGMAEPEEFLSRYFAGNQQIASAQPAIVMQQLAIKSKEQKSLTELLIALPDGVHEQVQERFPEFYSDVESFIHSYGDRTVGELKLETITMRLAPKTFYSYLRNYLLAPEALQVITQTHLHTTAEKELAEKLKEYSYFFRKSIYNSLEKLKTAIQYREAMRLERTRLFGMYRTLYLAAGTLLFTQKQVLFPRDIFYLTESEIEALLLLAQPAPDTEKIIAERKTAFDLYKQEDVPAQVVIPSPPAQATVATEQDGTLTGTGCVPGNVTAEIIIITGPEDNLDVSGKIVCAMRTDPGWVALFPACKGVLIEKGSALSHSVILLREFGIPAIINIAGLTKRLENGQTVSMDGASGIITIIE